MIKVVVRIVIFFWSLFIAIGLFYEPPRVEGAIDWGVTFILILFMILPWGLLGLWRTPPQADAPPQPKPEPPPKSEPPPVSSTVTAVRSEPEKPRKKSGVIEKLD